MKFIKIFALCALFFGCKKEEPIGPFAVDYSVSITFKNKENQDLLDTATINHFKIINIRCFEQLADGGKDEISLENKISKFDSGYVICLQLDHEITYLELNKDITDTIKCEFETTATTECISKVWYNGVLMWQADGTGKYFTVVK